MSARKSHHNDVTIVLISYQVSVENEKEFFWIWRSKILRLQHSILRSFRIVICSQIKRCKYRRYYKCLAVTQNVIKLSQTIYVLIISKKIVQGAFLRALYIGYRVHKVGNKRANGRTAR